jgi:uncharacterized damage-inducible protein DinB
MSPPDRSKGEYRSARHEGNPIDPPDRSKGEYRSAQHEGIPTNHAGPMIAPSYCQVMARYNRWMNERLYALLAAVDDAERKRDRGAFFGSMHGTLNHLLWGDLMWLGRFVGEPCSVPAFGAEMFADFVQLAHEREVADRRILDWAGGVSSEWLAGTLAYRSRVDGRNRELPRAVATMHFFNHGTHHRGQLTTLMKQAGVDPGVTDLPWLPGVVRYID